MSNFMECTDSEGFTDQITLGKTYKVLAFKGASVLINNDKGDAKYYGTMHFAHPQEY